MDIKKLRGFRAVVINGSLGAAAAVMHLSQPAMSRLISSLEAELKLALFKRERRRLLLTREGTEFYRETERILANLDELPQIVQDIKSSNARRLRIVALARVAYSLVSPAMKRFLANHPEQRLSVDVRGRRNMEQWVAGRHYDLGVAVTLPCDHPEIVCRPLFKAQAMAMMPKDHPLSHSRAVTAHDLSQHRVIGLAAGLRPRQQLDEIFRAADIEMTYQIETTSTPLACQLVADGLGVTVIDRMAALAVNTDRFVLRPIEPAYWMRFGVIFPQNHEETPLLDEVVDCLQRQVADTMGREAVEGLGRGSSRSSCVKRNNP
jgi:DNA-binding transcriptional LysR family regulator